MVKSPSLIPSAPAWIMPLLVYCIILAFACWLAFGFFLIQFGREVGVAASNRDATDTGGG